MAEFVSEREAALFVEQTAMASQPGQYSQKNNGFSVRQNNREGGGGGSGWNSNVSSNSSYPGGMWGGHSGTGLFSGNDHNDNALLGNMLGETM